MIATRPFPLLLLASLALGGCVVVSETNPTPRKLSPVSRDQTAPPAHVTISPLTRVGIDPTGQPAIFLHLDFREAGAKSVKAFGRLHVELFQPGAPAPSPVAPPVPPALSSSWDADLRDPIRNALSFDEMITRTYTINLSGAPEWLVHWVRREGPGADNPAPTLAVEFLPLTASGDAPPLKATATLTR